MTYRTSRRRALQLGLAATLAAPAVARAQQGWPAGPITWINPFPAGGGTDVFARPLAAQLGDYLGQQIVIDNRAAPAARSAPRSPPRRSPTATPSSSAPCTTPSRPASTRSSTTTWRRTSTDHHDRAGAAGGLDQPQRVPAKTACRVHRLRQEKPRQGELRLGRRRHRASPRGRAVQDPDRVPTSDPRALSRRGPGDAGPARRPRRHDVRRHGHLGACRSRRQAQGLAVATRQRVADFPDIPTGAEIGVPNCDRLDLVRAVGDQGHAAADRRAHVPGDGQGAAADPGCRRSGRIRRRSSAARLRRTSPSGSGPRSRSGRRSSTRPG